MLFKMTFNRFNHVERVIPQNCFRLENSFGEFFDFDFSLSLLSCYVIVSYILWLVVLSLLPNGFKGYSKCYLTS